MVSAPSSMLCPNMDAAIGVSANRAAASRPGVTPAQRRTARYRARTETIPSMTCGRASDQGWKPKMRADRACGRNEPASLSIVIVARGSNAP